MMLLNGDRYDLASPANASEVAAQVKEHCADIWGHGAQCFEGGLSRSSNEPAPLYVFVFDEPPRWYAIVPCVSLSEISVDEMRRLGEGLQDTRRRHEIADFIADSGPAGRHERRQTDASSVPSRGTLTSLVLAYHPHLAVIAGSTGGQSLASSSFEDLFAGVVVRQFRTYRHKDAHAHTFDPITELSQTHPATGAATVPAGSETPNVGVPSGRTGAPTQETTPSRPTGATPAAQRDAQGTAGPPASTASQKKAAPAGNIEQGKAQQPARATGTGVSASGPQKADLKVAPVKPVAEASRAQAHSEPASAGKEPASAPATSPAVGAGPGGAASTEHERVAASAPACPTAADAAHERHEESVRQAMAGASREVAEIFAALRPRILGLGKGIDEVVGSWWIDYRKGSTFMSFVTPRLKRNGMSVLLKLGSSKVDDPRELTTRSALGGELNTTFTIESLDQVDYAMSLIKQAYDHVRLAR